MAEEADLSRDTVSKPESGTKKRPHGITVGKITRALGVATMALADVPAADLRESDEPRGSCSANAADKEEAKRKALQGCAMP